MRNENVSKENVTQVSGKLQKSVIEVQQKYGDILNPSASCIGDASSDADSRPGGSVLHHFAALTGYKEAIEETERLAEKKNRAGMRVKAKKWKEKIW